MHRRSAAGCLSAFYRKKILFTYLLKAEIKLDSGVGHRYSSNLRDKFKTPKLRQTAQCYNEDGELHFAEKQTKGKKCAKPSNIAQP